MQYVQHVPSEVGTYALFLDLMEEQLLRIGSLGECRFPIGRYAYVGNAQGPGGLAGRLKRHIHFNQNKRPHWHIDHLNLLAEIIQIWWLVGSPGQECEWAESLSSLGRRMIPGFGSSDCRCPGHLIWFPQHQELSWLEAINVINVEPGNIGMTRPFERKIRG